MMHGVGNEAQPSIVPVTPAFPAMPPVVLPNIIGYASSIANRIKEHNNYTLADGKDLGIEGTEIVMDTDLKPQLKINLVAGHPEIHWVKNKMSSIEIWVDRGTGTFVFMTIAIGTTIADNYPLPATGTVELWKYKGIYRLKDNQVGRWSDETVIKV